MADRPEREGRGRLSSIEQLPEEAADDVIWAMQELAARKRTQTDILFEFNDRLEAKGLDPISRSAFNRRSMRMASSQRRQSERDAVLQAIGAKLSPKDINESTLILGEMLKTLIFELAEEQPENRTTKESMELSRAYLATVSGQKISADRLKLMDEYEKKTAAVIDKIAEEKGLSEEAVAQLRRDFLGVRPKEAA
ncbi:hypothetical protein C3941_09360 [Kaistia algarum]|uniref:phage protein Gp27 family protein n=1 Tax=Kaistia algarum TaxID=2083279 RepID=UPI000CE86733|nr:phage protein Gp27 family protein [Kaistia algarum]MCX5512267.1 DUF3486 family protein [Kaistia algarum]PPE80358.1 hypothetical protein C3941_09360 [Kaistia algarum]